MIISISAFCPIDKILLSSVPSAFANPIRTSSERAKEGRTGGEGKDNDIITCSLFLGVERGEGTMEAVAWMPVKVVKLNDVP